MPTVEVSGAKGSWAFSEAINDLHQGTKKVSLWSAFAWDEIQQRYRRSYLGLIWIVLSYVFFVGAIAVFFGGFAEMGSSQFLAYVAINYAIFLFLIGNVIDGCDVFRAAQNWIKSAPIPHSVYVYKSIARSLFIFAINMVVALIISGFAGWRPGALAWLSVLAFFVIMLNTIWVQILFGYAAARFRDLMHLVQAITRILFFTTPILWVREERSGIVGMLADLNPCTHYLEIFSAPLMGRSPSLTSWIIVLVLTILGFLSALLIAAYSRRRLAYWI